MMQQTTANVMVDAGPDAAPRDIPGWQMLVRTGPAEQLFGLDGVLSWVPGGSIIYVPTAKPDVVLWCETVGWFSAGGAWAV